MVSLSPAFFVPAPSSIGWRARGGSPPNKGHALAISEAPTSQPLQRSLLERSPHRSSLSSPANLGLQPWRAPLPPTACATNLAPPGSRPKPEGPHENPGMQTPLCSPLGAGRHSITHGLKSLGCHITRNTFHRDKTPQSAPIQVHAFGRGELRGGLDPSWRGRRWYLRR